MFKKTICSSACALVLTLVGPAIAEEPGQLVVRQASVGTLETHAVGGDINLFAAYFSPAPYAYYDREQFNVDIWNNMGGWQWASSYVISYPAGAPPFEVNDGYNWISNEEIRIETAIQTPVFFRFDEIYGEKYVLILDRANTDMGVHVAGDVNEDGYATIVDALIVARATTGLVELSRIGRAIADVNCDNAVTIVDALLLAQASTGLDTLGCK